MNKSEIADGAGAGVHPVGPAAAVLATSARDKSARRDAYLYMDALRAVAALLVVLNHARDLTSVDAADAHNPALAEKATYFLAGLGHEAVMIFFVLSGFWISHTANRKFAEASFWPAFLKDRLSRLLIVIVPTLILGGLLDYLGAAIIGGPGYFGGLEAHSVPPDVLGSLSVQSFLGNLVFVQTLLVPAFGSNGPLWSLANEFWYYMWFAALFTAARGRPGPMLLSLAIALMWPGLLYGFAIWLMGSAVYHADNRVGNSPVWRGYAPAILGCGLILFLVALTLARFDKLHGWGDAAVGGAFSLVLWGLLRGAIRFPRRRLNFLATFGAGSSFSLYLIHYPLIMFAIACIGLTARLQPGWTAFAIMGGLILGAVAAAWIFSRATEANTPRLRRMLGG